MNARLPKPLKMHEPATRVGFKSDLPNVAGWCLLIGENRRKWLPNLPKDAAYRIMKSTGAAWARRYVIENGKRVVLV